MTFEWVDPFVQRALYQLGFYALACIAVFSAVMVVTLKNLVHNVLFLAATMLAVAGLFVYLNAGFLAMVQIFLYVGGVTVLFLFAVMLTFGITDVRILQTNHFKALSALISATLFGTIFLAIRRTAFTPGIANLSTGDVTDSLGVALLSKYVLPFEIASLLLLAALVGAIVLAKEEKA